MVRRFETDHASDDLAGNRPELSDVFEVDTRGAKLIAKTWSRPSPDTSPHLGVCSS